MVLAGAWCVYEGVLCGMYRVPLATASRLVRPGCWQRVQQCMQNGPAIMQALIAATSAPVYKNLSQPQQHG
jgi:hypothetical protein